MKRSVSNLGDPHESHGRSFTIPMNHEPRRVKSGQFIELKTGSRVTLVPGIYHEFWPVSEECVISEVSTANDDLNDNFFMNSNTGCYPGIEEDEPAEVQLLSDK